MSKEYKGEKYKWECNNCFNTWYSNSRFEDLCPNLHCEDDSICCQEISENKKKEYFDLKAKIAKHKAAIPVLEKYLSKLP